MTLSSRFIRRLRLGSVPRTAYKWPARYRSDGRAAWWIDAPGAVSIGGRPSHSNFSKPWTCVIEVGAFYWTVSAPDIVNSGREEQGLVSL